MRDPALQSRFDELDAARALGDLSPEERVELDGLIERENFESDSDLDWIVASLEVSRGDFSQPLEPGLREKILSDGEESGGRSDPGEVIGLWKHPAIGWAAAAGLVLAFVLSELMVGVPRDTLSDARDSLIQTATSMQLEFAGTDDFSALQGDVVWGDEQQEGYMMLSGLPANDPEVSQYQLWIVDPERDSAPVDGGVFDIQASGGATIVPVAAALKVAQPVAFVITVEKPGGVVVSKQETVAAVAKRAS